MHKILWDFEIQTDRKFPAGGPDLMLIASWKTKPRANSQLEGQT